VEVGEVARGLAAPRRGEGQLTGPGFHGELDGCAGGALLRLLGHGVLLAVSRVRGGGGPAGHGRSSGIGTGRTPRGSSSEAPPSSAVSTQTPSACRATECSHWLERAPSVVTTVHSSSSTRVPIPPRTSIGSMA